MKFSSFLDEAQPIVCTQRDADKYGRVVATCVNSFGQDVAIWLVQNGHAIDWPLYSKGEYCHALQLGQITRMNQ